jgi:hypothetical protein
MTTRAISRKTPRTTAKWSAQVRRTSDALDLKSGIFKGIARQIAHCLKRSAMSMLNFEINRGGKGLSAGRRQVLNRAKDELRKAYGRPTRPA